MGWVVNCPSKKSGVEPRGRLAAQPFLPPRTPLPPLPQAFAADLQKLFVSLQAIDTELIVQAGAGGVSAQVAADDAAVNRFLLDLVRCAGLRRAALRRCAVHAPLGMLAGCGWATLRHPEPTLTARPLTLSQRGREQRHPLPT